MHMFAVLLDSSLTGKGSSEWDAQKFLLIQ